MKPPFASLGRDYLFGDFRFMPDRQTLLHRGEPVALGARAMDLLHLLVERAGEVVGPQTLRAHVWPGQRLHESNLKVNLSMLRRVLGRDPAAPPAIATVAGRGYRFILPVTLVEGPIRKGSAIPGAQNGALPAIPEVIGRDTMVSVLTHSLPQNRLLTLLGPAGVGKTTLAIAAAQALQGRFADGICFVDLASVAAPELVVPVVGLTLGVQCEVAAGLVDALLGRGMLMLLDTCEHLLKPVAAMAEHLHQALPALHILATSREAMGSRYETVMRLAPLPCPDEGRLPDAASALAFPAINLFVRRAQAVCAYRLTDADAPAVAALCRKLDGLPLAIELAASRMTGSGVAGLQSLIAQGLGVLAMPAFAPRHRTLLSTLDWSYRLLSPGDAQVLRVLSVFAGAFGLEDVLALAGHEGAPEVAARVDSLVAKSLLSVTYGGGLTRYRFLDSTRDFAAEQLAASGEARAARHAHARHLLTLFQRAEAEWFWRERGEWTALYGARQHDLRKAIDWALGPQGDAALGIALTVAAIPLWDELSSVGESHVRVERALQALREGGWQDPAAEMKLMASFGAALNFSEHLGPRADAVWDQGWRLAVALGSTDYQLRTLWGQAVLQSFSGRHGLALATLGRFMALAQQESDLSALPDGERLVLMTRFYMGDIAGAGDGLARLERLHAAQNGQTRMARFQVDRTVGLRVALAMTVWIRGDHQRATLLARLALERAQGLGHRVSHSNALAQIALPLALLLGKVEEARGHLALLAHNLSLHDTTIWTPVCRFYQGAVAGYDGDPGGLATMREAVAGLVRNRFLIRVPMYLAMLADCATALGQRDMARHALEEAGQRMAAQGERWYEAEILRVQGLLAWQEGDTTGAGHLLARACHRAAGSGALSLQLRAVTTLAQLMLSQGKGREAARHLAPVLARFAPGSPSLDVARAAALLTELAGG